MTCILREEIEMTDQYQDTGERPFGQVEGEYAEIRTIRYGFIEFDPQYGDVSLRPDEQDVRILVGRMGSGKSINLRRLHDYNNKLGKAVYTGAYTGQSQGRLTTECVRFFSECFSLYSLTENWKLLWRRAIIRALVSHLVHKDGLQAWTRQIDIPTLRRQNSLLSDQGTPTDVATEAQLIIEGFRRSHPRAQKESTRNTILAFLQSPAWTRIEYEVATALAHCPPIFFYVDAIDNEFRSAPSYWLRAQKGLFYQIYEFLREEHWREKLHVIAAVRDMVLSAVFESEHGHRYLNENHHRVLAWTRDSIGVFLERKIGDLSDQWLIDANASHPMERWLGSKLIVNRVRNVTEAMDDYLVRHTRSTPRDIVQLGNQLCHYVRRTKSDGRDIEHSAIRSIVSNCSHHAATFEISHCANQIDSDLGHHLDDSVRYVGEQENLQSETALLLQELLKEVGVDRFDWQTVLDLRQRARDVFQSANLDVPTILWQNGLIGYVAHGEEDQRWSCFYSKPTVGSNSLRKNADEYVLHPVLLDLIPEISPIGDPVDPMPLLEPWRA
jgi:hypothetical protein